MKMNFLVLPWQILRLPAEHLFFSLFYFYLSKSNAIETKLLENSIPNKGTYRS